VAHNGHIVSRLLTSLPTAYHVFGGGTGKRTNHELSFVRALASSAKLELSQEADQAQLAAGGN